MTGPSKEPAAAPRGDRRNRTASSSSPRQKLRGRASALSGQDVAARFAILPITGRDVPFMIRRPRLTVARADNPTLSSRSSAPTSPAMRKPRRRHRCREGVRPSRSAALRARVRSFRHPRSERWSRRAIRRRSAAGRLDLEAEIALVRIASPPISKPRDQQCPLTASSSLVALVDRRGRARLRRPPPHNRPRDRL